MLRDYYLNFLNQYCLFWLGNIMNRYQRNLSVCIYTIFFVERSQDLIPDKIFHLTDLLQHLLQPACYEMNC